MSESEGAIPLNNDARRARISSLLLRYPELLNCELGELIDFYKTAPPVETALLTCEKDVAAKARLFLKDHEKATSRGVEAPLVLVIFTLVSVGIMFSLAYHLSG